MPFDYKPLEMETAIRYRNNAPWIELYLVGVAYGVFARDRVSPDYYTLDQTTPVYEMPQVVSRLNAELTRLSLPSISPVKTFEEFIEALRTVIKASNRSKAIDWLVGHKNPGFWDLANEKNVWSLPKDELYKFCDELFESTRAEG